MIKNKIGIGTLLLAILLVYTVFVPAVSAKDNTNDQLEGSTTIQRLASNGDGNVATQSFVSSTDGDITIQSTVSDASLTVTPSQATKGSTFKFKGDATYTAEVYGIPLPDLLWFANDVNYTAFNKPVITSASSTNDYVYKSDTNIGKAWTHRYYVTMLGGPTTKHVYSDAVSKSTGRYQNRQYAGLTLVGGDNAYVYTTIT
jgi:hypothetical protein